MPTPILVDVDVFNWIVVDSWSLSLNKQQYFVCSRRLKQQAQPTLLSSEEDFFFFFFFFARPKSPPRRGVCYFSCHTRCDDYKANCTRLANG